MNKILNNTSKLVILSLLLYPTQYFENKANAIEVDSSLIEYNEIGDVEEVNHNLLTNDSKLINYNTTNDIEDSELDNELYNDVLEQEHSEILNNLNDKFKENGMTIVKSSIEDSHIIIDARTESNGAIAHFDYDIVEGDFDIKSVVDNKVETFDADVTSDSNDNTIANLTNTQTKDSVVVQTDSVHNNVVQAIPIVIASGVEIILSVTAAYFIVVEGQKMVVAAKSIANIMKSSKRKYNHYRAVLKNYKLYIGSGLSRANAIKRAKSKKDVWSVSKNQAKEVAKGANRNGLPIHEIDKNRKGKYFHYHPYLRTPKMHSFYGKAQ